MEIETSTETSTLDVNADNVIDGSQSGTHASPYYQCETCGNHYEHPFQVVTGGISHTFDCFECAIEALAPRCAHCHCRVIGHGVAENHAIYCCAHCARQGNGRNDSTGAAAG